MATVNKTNLRLITRLVEAGITTEKSVVNLSIVDAVSIPGITVGELKAITEMQNAIKEKRLMSFFVEEENKQEENKNDGNKI